MYLYAVVSGKCPKSDHNPFMGIVTRKVETKVGANNRNNMAFAIAHDYGNNHERRKEAIVQTRKETSVQSPFYLFNIGVDYL